MIKVGDKYKYVGGYRDFWHRNALSHLGLELKVGDVIEVLEVGTNWCKDNGVSKFCLQGGVHEISKEHPHVWSLFTFDMVGIEAGYGIQLIEEKVVGSGVGEHGRNLGSLSKGYTIPTPNPNIVTKPLEERYNEWVLENIHVYELFCKFTLQAISSGKKKISHWLIVNRLRWEVEIETKSLCAEDKEYKISNDYIAFLARDFIKDYPEHDEIFNLKQMKRV